MLQELFNNNALFFVTQFKDQVSSIIKQVMADLIQKRFDGAPENKILPDWALLQFHDFDVFQ